MLLRTRLHAAHTRTAAWLVVAALLPATAAAQVGGSDTQAQTPSLEIAAAAERPGPFDRGGVGVEFAAGWLGEAWNLNDRREWLLDGTAGVWWSFANRFTLVTELHLTRVFQERPRAAFVNGFSPQVRWAVWRPNPWAVFVELGPGLSWSDTAVPPRGTRFNYLLLAGSGVTRRISRQCHVLAAFRWVHVSNNGREGRGRNPDIEALGGYGGLTVAF